MEVFAREDLKRAVHLAGSAGSHPKGYRFREEAHIRYEIPDLKTGSGSLAEVEARYIELTSDAYDEKPTWFFHGVIDADADAVNSDRIALGKWLEMVLNAHYVHVKAIYAPTAEIMAHFL